jgi:hypothetical protein
MTPSIILFIVVILATIILLALNKGSSQQDPLEDFLKEKRSKK